MASVFLTCFILAFHSGVDNLFVDNLVDYHYCTVDSGIVDTDIVLGCCMWGIVVLVLELPLALLSILFFDCQVAAHETSTDLAPTSSSPRPNIRDQISKG
jgi:hypothetical protein